MSWLVFQMDIPKYKILNLTFDPSSSVLLLLLLLLLLSKGRSLLACIAYEIKQFTIYELYWVNKGQKFRTHKDWSKVIRVAAHV
jgi:hypothetical protein